MQTKASKSTQSTTKKPERATQTMKPESTTKKPFSTTSTTRKPTTMPPKTERPQTKTKDSKNMKTLSDGMTRQISKGETIFGRDLIEKQKKSL